MARKGPTQLPEFVAHQATTPPPEPDLLQHLSFEHRQIERLWSELQLGHRRHIETDYRPGTRLGGHGQHELFRNIMNLLAEHEALELQMLYPAVRRVVGDEMADHATADHEEIRRLLDDVDGEDPTDEHAAFLVERCIEEIEQIAAVATSADTTTLDRIAGRNVLRRPSRAAIIGGSDVEVPDALERGDLVVSAGRRAEKGEGGPARAARGEAGELDVFDAQVGSDVVQVAEVRSVVA